MGWELLEGEESCRDGEGCGLSDGEDAGISVSASEGRAARKIFGSMEENSLAIWSL